MAGQLTGKRIAVLTTDGVEKVELVEPLMALREAGATVEVLAPHTGSVQAMDHDERSGTIPVDRRIGEADAADYDGLVLPGGVINADHLRSDEDAVNFAASFLERGMPVGVICHGPWLLIETGLLAGRIITSYPTLRTDLENAGAYWVDEEVCNDKGLVSSRRPRDLPAFCAKIIEEFAEGRHTRRAA